MAAYMIVNIDVKDPARYEEYKAKVPAIVRKALRQRVTRTGIVVVEGL